MLSCDQLFSGDWILYFWVAVALVLIVLFHDPIKIAIDYVMKGIKIVIQAIAKFFKWIKNLFSKNKKSKK